MRENRNGVPAGSAAISGNETDCFNTEEAVAMAEAGADILIPHMGLTAKGSIGAETALTLEQAAQRVQEMHDAATLPQHSL